MLVHSNQFKTAAQSLIKQTSVQVSRQVLDTYGYVDSVPVWKSGDLLVEVSIDSVGLMLGTVTKKAVVKLIGIEDDVSAGDIYKIKLGVNTSGNVYEDQENYDYTSQGFYIVDTVDFNYDTNSTVVTMYDHMWKANGTKYVEVIPENSIIYPVTIEYLASHVASLLNMDLDPNFGSLPNATQPITEDLYTKIPNATLKNVIQDIAGATGTTARVTDTTLVFSQYALTGDNLDSNELRKLKVGDTYGPVNSVVLGRVPQNDNISISATNPSTSAVSAVDDTLNLLTIVNHSMGDGNMVQLDSTGALPAPLVAGQSYYIYTNGDANTFALANTHTDSINGTNLIDLTDQGSGDITIRGVNIKEIRINNNEMLDDNRQTMLPPLYNSLSGLEWSAVSADTIGLGWFEVGDVVQFTQGTATVNAFIEEIHLKLDGAVKESLTSNIPESVVIDYAAAGGIANSIYNTEIKVDKQEQDITSVVSRQDTFEGNTYDSFTEVYQNIENISLTVQKAGGGNLLLNSVGYAREQFKDSNNAQYDKLLFWDYNDPYTVSGNGSTTSYTSSESQNYGGISGQVVEMSGTDMKISQTVDLAVNTPLSFGVNVKNIIGTGGATIRIENDNDLWEVVIDDSATQLWKEIKIENFVTTMPWVKVSITSNSALRFMFTDLRLIYGTTIIGWVQANSEILSTNVQFTKNGMRIFDSVHDTETRVTYNEFSTVRKTDGEVLFEADDLGVLTNNLSIKGGTNYMKGTETVIRQVTIGSPNTRAGLAFIKVLETS